MKKYKYTQLLEISLALALEKIERLENSKPPLIPDEDPVVPYTMIKAPPYQYPDNFKITYGTDPKKDGVVSDKVTFTSGYAGSVQSSPNVVNIPKNGRTGEILANLETTPNSVKATFRKNNSPENEAYFATMKQVQEEVANYPESKRAGVLSITSEARQGDEDYLDLEAIRKMEPQTTTGEMISSLLEYEPDDVKLPPYLARVKPHLPETIAWCHKTLEGYPPVSEMIDKLKAKLELGNQALGKKLKVGKDTIVSWRSNPQQFHNPYKIVNLIALYNEHFSVPEFWSAISSFEQGQQSTLSETSVGCIKVGEEIITEKPTPPLSVAPPKALQKVPRLMQHTDSVELLNIPQRALNALQAVSIRTMGDLVQWPEEGLKNIRGLGDKSFKEIVNKTLKAGFRFTRLGK